MTAITFHSTTWDDCVHERNDDEKLEQDKVNYAVSEKEYRVTDLTTLTRMAGCTGMFWAATGLY